MKVVGFEDKRFKFDDGKTVSGQFIYLSEERDGVTGMACERVFLSDNKLSGYIPVIGDEVEVSYNRFGKPQRITRL